MMDAKKVKELFENAKISYTTQDLELMTEKLGIMVSVADKVNEFEGGEDVFASLPKSSKQMRGDAVGVSMSKNELMSNLPAGEDCFCVPSVISGEVRNEA